MHLFRHDHRQYATGIRMCVYTYAARQYRHGSIPAVSKLAIPAVCSLYTCEYALWYACTLWIVRLASDVSEPLGLSVLLLWVPAAAQNVDVNFYIFIYFISVVDILAPRETEI